MSKIIRDRSVIKKAGADDLFAKYEKPEPGRKIIKVVAPEESIKHKKHSFVDSETTRALKQSEILLKKAKKEAEEILENGRQQASLMAEQARAEGRLRGYEEGRNQGHHDALEEFRNAVADVIEDMNNLVDEVRAQREKIIKNAESEIIELALAIASKIVEAELKVNKSIVLNSSRKALEKVVNGSRVKLRVSLRDFDLVKEHIDSLAGKTGISAAIDLVADANISSGGCLVETDSGRIDAQIETQLDELRNDLLKQSGRHE